MFLIEKDEIIETRMVDFIVFGCREEAGSGSQVNLILTLQNMGVAFAIVVCCLLSLDGA